ncbi:hypothetical protein BVL54_19900 [Bacillus paralicheniformis]|nr:hypothetical protein BVL54_19900 [Bacillus paralicheniformis]
MDLQFDFSLEDEAKPRNRIKEAIKRKKDASYQPTWRKCGTPDTQHIPEVSKKESSNRRQVPKIWNALQK